MKTKQKSLGEIIFDALRMKITWNMESWTGKQQFHAAARAVIRAYQQRQKSKASAAVQRSNQWFEDGCPGAVEAMDKKSPPRPPAASPRPEKAGDNKLSPKRNGGAR